MKKYILNGEKTIEIGALKNIEKEIEDYEGFDENTYYQMDRTRFQIIETTLKNQKRKLDLIGEILVDVSKGNYSDLDDAINEIREVLENE